MSGGEPKQHRELTSPAALGDAIERLRGAENGSTVGAITDDLVVDQEGFDLLLDAAASDEFTFAGAVVGDLRIDAGDRPRRHLVLHGSIPAGINVVGDWKDISLHGPAYGWLVFDGSCDALRAIAQFDGPVSVTGQLRNFSLTGTCESVLFDRLSRVEESVHIGSEVADFVSLSGRIGGDLVVSYSADRVDVANTATVGGDIVMSGSVSSYVWVGADVEGSAEFRTATIGGSVLLDGAVGCEVSIDERSKVAGLVRLNGPVGSDVHVYGPVGQLQLGRQAQIAGWVSITQGIGGDAAIGGHVAHWVSVRGGVEGDCSITATGLSQGVVVDGPVGGSLTIAPEESPGNSKVPVHRLRGTFAGEVIVGEGVSLHSCDFRGFLGFSKLRLRDPRPFHDETSTRQRIDFARSAPNETAATWMEQELVYRELRRVHEAHANRPAASDFYFGEMEARRNRAREAGFFSGEHVVLWAYRWVSEYGTRSRNATAAFALAIVISAAGFALGGVDLRLLDADGAVTQPGLQKEGLIETWSAAEVGELLLFSLQSLVAFVSPPSATLSIGEKLAQVFMRFLGPLLIAQIVLSLRDRVSR